MDEQGKAYANKVSPQEASTALEALTNLLFLTAQHADDGTMVRRFVADTESSVAKLAQFIRPYVKSAHKMPSPPQSSGIRSDA